MKLCERQICTGCAACANVCPDDAVVLEADEEGFLRPKIIADRCISCGKCARACPQMSSVGIPDEPKMVFACWHKDRSIRRESTSGGVFAALAEEVLRRGGKVYGAAFDGFPRVAHVGIESVHELKRLQGSKYVQSEIGHVFKDVEKEIAKGRSVLFSGTPCQIAGLYGCLGSRHEGQLTTIDIVCHGVPSAMVFSDYVKWMEEQRGAKIVEYRFRDKAIGWYLHSTAIRFSNGSSVVEHLFKNTFSCGYLRDYFLRPSCHNCPYAGTGRPADITLSDFWGYKGKRKDRRDKDDDKGISMVMLNTSAGVDLFGSVRERLVVWERGMDEAVAVNRALREPSPASHRREQFWYDYRHLTFGEVAEKYMYPEELTGWWAERYTLHGKLRSLERKIVGRFKRGARKILGEGLLLRVKTFMGKGYR